MARYPVASLSLMSLFALGFLVGCGGGGSSSDTTPSVHLQAAPNPIAPGGTATLTWSSKNVSTVDSSNFGATSVAGSAVVGPLNATTDYTITCSGSQGTASAHVTVVVNSGGTVTSIPAGSLVYSLQNPTADTTLYYQLLTGGAPVAVNNFASGTTVLDVSGSGTRLLLAKPVNGDPTKIGAFISDLDGFSHTVRLGTATFSAIPDGSFTAPNRVVLACLPNTLLSYTTGGAKLAETQAGGAIGAAVNASGSEVAVLRTNEITRLSFPQFNFEGVQMVGGGSYSWVRWSPASEDVTYADSGNIYTVHSDGTAKTLRVSNGAFPTFDSSGSRILFSRLSDGIYAYDLNANTTTKLFSISGTWDGHFIRH